MGRKCGVIMGSRASKSFLLSSFPGICHFQRVNLVYNVRFFLCFVGLTTNLQIR